MFHKCSERTDGLLGDGPLTRTRFASLEGPSANETAQLHGLPRKRLACELSLLEFVFLQEPQEFNGRNRSKSKILN